MNETQTAPRPREASFTLPFGVPDDAGGLHRDGVMRVPTMDDLVVVLHLAEGVENPAYLAKLLLARTLVRLGDLVLNEMTREEIIGEMPLPDVECLNTTFRHLVALPKPAPAAEAET